MSPAPLPLPLVWPSGFSAWTWGFKHFISCFVNCRQCRQGDFCGFCSVPVVDGLTGSRRCLLSGPPLCPTAPGLLGRPRLLLSTQRGPPGTQLCGPAAGPHCALGNKAGETEGLTPWRKRVRPCTVRDCSVSAVVSSADTVSFSPLSLL